MGTRKGKDTIWALDSKMWTSRSIANSRKMLTEKNDSGFITNIRIWLVSDTGKH